MPERIGIIHTQSLRQFARAMPDLSRLHTHHEHDEIVFVTDRTHVDLANRTGYFNRIWATPPRRNILSDLIFSLRLKQFKFDRIYYIGERKPRFISAEKLPAMDGPVLKDWCNRDISFYQLPEKYALIHTGGRLENKWSAMRLGTFCKKLVLDKITPVLIGQNSSDKYLERIEKICPGAVDFTRQVDVVDMAGLARGAVMAIAPDHDDADIIAFTNCPTLCLYTDNDPLPDVLPQGAKVIVLQDDLESLSVNTVYSLLKEHRVL